MAALLRMNLCSPLSNSSLKSPFRSPNLDSKSVNFPFDPLKSLPGCKASRVQRPPRLLYVRLSCDLRLGKENEDMSQIFEDWCKEHGISYTSDEDKLAGFRAFKYNYEYASQHNWERAAYSLCLNRFSDQAADELGPRKLGDEARVISCKDVECLNKLLAEKNKLTVLACTAEWCQPCVLMEKVLEDWAPRMPIVTMVAVDVVVDELKAIAVEKWEVVELPTMLFVKNGQVLDKVEGAEKDEFYLKLAVHVGLPWGSIPMGMWKSP